MKSLSTKKFNDEIEKQENAAATTDVTSETTAVVEEANAVPHLDEI